MVLWCNWLALWTLNPAIRVQIPVGPPFFLFPLFVFVVVVVSLGLGWVGLGWGVELVLFGWNGHKSVRLQKLPLPMARWLMDRSGVNGLVFN